MTTSNQSEPEKMLTIRIAGDVSVCVPNDIRLMTPYVLLEQEDWFEDDIHFVRRLVHPGDAVVDIGANYGVYTLSMARTVGGSGRIWAIDPSRATMRHLEQSVGANNFNHITLIHAGLSDQVGKAWLPREENPELGAVASVASANSDEIDLLTLDECEQRYGWQNISFIKMDAEGHENRILRGGAHFLSNQSPLIMYEIKAGSEFNRSLIGEFAALGYWSYRLLPMPGGEMLVPLERLDEQFDPYILNLYCCKPDRADELSARGLLCRELVTGAPAMSGHTQWKLMMAKEMHAETFSKVWDGSAVQRESQSGWATHRSALNHYAMSKDTGVGACARAAHLKAAFDILGEQVGRDANLSRLLSLARIATEYGRRGVTVSILQQLMSVIERQSLPVADEPFLAPPGKPCPVGDSIGRWQARAIAESCVRSAVYSDYFKGDGNLPLLDVLCSLGYASPEMERRRQLIRMRHGHRTERIPSLTQRSPDNINPEFWSV